MERWRRVFRLGICPQLKDSELYRLKAGLAMDSETIIQGRTCRWSFDGLKVCPLGYASGLHFAEEVEEWFLGIARGCALRLEESACIRHLTLWVDNNERKQVFAELLEEVKLEMEQRAKVKEKQYESKNLF